MRAAFWPLKKNQVDHPRNRFVLVLFNYYSDGLVFVMAVFHCYDHVNPDTDDDIGGGPGLSG